MRNQNLDKLHTTKYQKHADCSYDYKLVCTVERFSKSYLLTMSYLSKVLYVILVYNVINSILKNVNTAVMF